MKTVRDYLIVAKQFTFIPNDSKIVILIDQLHGVDLAMLKFVLIRHLEKDIADKDCSCCAFSRFAKVWLMCDKHGKHATNLCDDFQLHENVKKFDANTRQYIAELRNITDYDEFINWINTHGYGYKFYSEPEFYNDIYDCCVDEAAAQKALSIIAQRELKETEYHISKNADSLAKLQQTIADLQDALKEKQNHIQQLNKFLAENPI